MSDDIALENLQNPEINDTEEEIPPAAADGEPSLETAANPEETLEDTIERKAKKIAGKAISEERKKLKHQLNQQLNEMEARYREQLQQAYYPQAQMENAILDPQTNEYVDINSVQGQLALRELKVKERVKKEQEQRQLQQKQHVYNDLNMRLQEGYEEYENYDQAIQTFLTLGTDNMAEALAGVEAPAAIVNYLSDKKGEFNRIARLSPQRQMREIFKIEERLNPTKKLVSNAPQPINSVNESRNVAASPANQTLGQRYDYWNKHFNHRG